jgi:ribosome-binding protein aMBF1 (putative translation factor)
MALTADQTTAMQHWNNAVAHRAEGNTSHSQGLPLARALMIAVNHKLSDASLHVNEATVGGWLKGTCVPQTKAIHTALMDALQLPKMPAPAPSMEGLSRRERRAAKAIAAPPPPLEGLAKRLAELRQALERDYDTLPDEVKTALQPAPEKPQTQVTGRKAAAKTLNPDKRDRAQVAGDFSDSPYIPKRLLAAGSTYEELSAGERARIFRETENVHEFLTLYRLRHKKNSETAGDSRKDMAHKLGTYDHHIRNLEIGAILPSKATLLKFEEAMNAADADIYTRLEDMTIANRLAYVAGTIRERDSTVYADPKKFGKSISNIMQEMPPRYWRTVIAQFIDKRKFEAQQGKPAWVKEMEPIECKEDYLQAMRGLLSLTQEAVAHEVGSKTPTVTTIESSMQSPESPVGKRLVAFYQAQQAKMLQDEQWLAPEKRSPKFFDRRKYDALPIGYDPSLAAGYAKGEYAQLVAQIQAGAAAQRSGR